MSCIVRKCRRGKRSSEFCSHHWRMVPERSRRAIIRGESQAEQLARVQVEAAEREDQREERIENP